MNLRETGFTFLGKHSYRDMGLIYAEKDGHVNTPRIEWNTYEIAGMDGDILFPGETRRTMTFEGTLYPVQERASQQEAQTLLRRVSAWLAGGRGRLIFDYETDKYYLAELAAESKWSLKSWFGGEISVRFSAQPWAYSVQEAGAYGTGSTAVTVRLTCLTGAPAPVSFDIENTGTATVTGVSLGDGAIAFSGLSLAAGEILTVSGEPPIGAMIGTVSALRYADAFGQITVTQGISTLTAAVTYSGSGTRSVKVTARARGRW